MSSGLFVGVSSDKSMHSQEMLQAFVDVAARIEDKQSILELPGLSAERIIFEKRICQLLKDTTDGSCHGGEINKRYMNLLLVGMGCVLENSSQVCCH